MNQLQLINFDYNEFRIKIHGGAIIILFFDVYIFMANTDNVDGLLAFSVNNAI